MTVEQSALFSPYKIRETTLPNRVVLAPMMQCKAVDGFASDWHFAHFSKFALGGFGTVMTEAIAVEPRGRITYGDLGLWSDEFIPDLKRVTDFIHAQGALAAIQLAHAGRKACWQRPWEGNGPLTQADAVRGETPWGIVGPSDLAVGENYQTPHPLSVSEIREIVKKFGQAAARAHTAGFDIIEIHGAHPAISDELLLTAGEFQISTDSHAVLDNLGERTGIPQMRRVVATLQQTLQYGTPLSEALRVLSAEMRQEILTRFEEKAARLPVLLTMPMIIFILPVLFLIVGGPAVLQAMRLFGK